MTGRSSLAAVTAAAADAADAHDGRGDPGYGARA